MQPAHSTRGRLIHWARILLVVAVVLAAGYALWSNHEVVQETLAELSWRDWLPSFVALPIAILLSTLSWQLLVDELGEPIGVARGAQIFLVGQLGKYLPGSVWAYVLQIELGRRAGLARARVFTATLFSLAVAVVAALLAGSLVLPGFIRDYEALRGLVWLYLLLPVGLVCLHPAILQRIVSIGFRVLGRPQPDHPVRLRAVALSLLAAVASYGFFGLHLWLLVRGVSNVDGNASFLLVCIGTMAIAMISGLFFFLLPSGAGVRELIIVTALAPTIGSGEAIAIAAVSRVLIVLADLLTAASAAGLGWWERRHFGPIPHDQGIDDDEA